MAGLLSGRKKKERAETAAAQAALTQRFSERLRSTLENTAARDEARAFPRKRDLRVASAMFSPVKEKTCRVIDYSYSGMQIEFLSDEICPEEFALTVPTLAFIGVVKKAWQSDGVVGVSILRWSDAD